jgi:hypothetical protein
MFQPSVEEKPGFIFYFSFLSEGLGPAYIESIEFAGDASLQSRNKVLNIVRRNINLSTSQTKQLRTQRPIEQIQKKIRR